MVQTIEIAEALGRPRGPSGFGESWTPRPVILVVNKADVLADKQKEVRSRPAQHSTPCATLLAAGPWR